MVKNEIICVLTFMAEEVRSTCSVQVQRSGRDNFMIPFGMPTCSSPTCTVIFLRNDSVVDWLSFRLDEW